MVHTMDSLKLLNKSVAANTNDYSNTKTDEIIPRFTMMYALKKGYLNLIRHLLCTGVNPNQIDSKDKFYRTPLIYCSYIKDSNWALSISQNLLECGARLEQCDRRGLNVLHYCCAFNKYKLLELFIKSLDFDLLNEVDINGNTCLHYATAFRNLKCIRLILNKCKHYNLTNIEHENAFGFKPSDMLGLNHLHYSQEIDEKCKLILSNYDKNLLPNRQLFDQLENSVPLTIRISSTKNKFRPTTAPLSVDENNDDEKKQKICFTVIENLPKQNSINEKKRSFSTQSQTIFKLHNQNENSKENLGTHISNSNSSFGIRPKIKQHQLSKTSFDTYYDNSNQLLIDMKDYLSQIIIFSELCMDKEYIVNPKGINSMVIANNYHLTQPTQKLINESKNNLKTVNEMLLGRISSSKTQKSFQLSLDDSKKVEQNNFIISKPLINNAKTLRSPSMTVISGRQSRQSFFAGCLVSSQSGKKFKFCFYLLSVDFFCSTSYAFELRKGII
jgi:hypothetical protein